MMTTEVQVKDVAGVRSRISWGAILGGAMTAIAVYFLLSVLGIAIGATVAYRTGDFTSGIGLGAAIWSVITLMLALFCGGCVASQCTAGETKEESIIYGVILWGTMFTMLVWLMASRVNVGFVDVMSATGAYHSSASLTPTVPEKDLRDQKFSEEQLTWFRQQNFVQTENVKDQVRNAAQDSRTVSAAWWTFGGILLSMLAAISGALTGAGPNFTLVGVRSLAFGRHHASGARTAV